MTAKHESTKQKGDKGESLAASFLENKGYQLVARNWRYERLELDLIASKDNQIIFIEVKTRYSNTYGEPWEAVNKAKRKKICAGADAYIQQHDIHQEPRFDIISIIHNDGQTEIEHIENAFWPMA